MQYGKLRKIAQKYKYNLLQPHHLPTFLFSYFLLSRIRDGFNRRFNQIVLRIHLGLLNGSKEMRSTILRLHENKGENHFFAFFVASLPVRR